MTAPLSTWQPLSSIPPSATGAPSYLALLDYAAWQLDADALRSQLAAAPLEFTAAADQPLEFQLPTPDGSFSRFALVESPIMAPELAALFPEIRTYAGQGIDDPAATVRLDLTPHGFHAQVLSPSGTYYVDPYYHLDSSVHVSYFRSDVDAAARRATLGPLHAEIEHAEKTAIPLGPTQLEDTPLPNNEIFESTAASRAALQAAAKGSTAELTAKAKSGDGNTAQAKGNSGPQARSGTQLRTYRAAVAATGEYTDFHGGSVALGQAAIVTAMNRVSGVYESELSIRFNLVPNNHLLVYTDDFLDPYSNDDPPALLAQNQSNIDSVIGSANYDIGHVFGTGGGGLAASGVGVSGWKAQGETGSPFPIGDFFYIDYVVHEIGHQFDADHSWSGTTGSCSASNYAYETGVEPGSGTTVMSYAGICGGDNLASFVDPQFHAVNFDEIIHYVDNVIPTVGTRTTTGNSVPTVNAGADVVIPTGTPFTLTASGSDADAGDVLTYSWEQMDSGAQRLLSGPDNGTSALFRSRPPVTSPVRTFPPLSNILANTSAPGETLPAVGRTLDFRVTARDNRAGGGGVNTDDVRVKVVNTGAPFRVVTPNTAVHWAAKSTQLVTWDPAGTTGNGINVNQVHIMLSTDGGLTFPIMLAAGTTNDGSQLVNIPDLAPTSTARIRIQAVGNIFFDVSNANFFIDAASPEQTDWGDAPDPQYATLLASDGPRHTIGGPRLGDYVDGEANGQQSSTANGDGADDDGVAIPPLMVGQNIVIRVNPSASGATLNYFFDFDRNGVFGNTASEVFSRTFSGGGPQLLVVPVPADASPGPSFARFRISTAGGLGPTGPAADGEVEDYPVMIYSALPPTDFGDAPSFASTFLAHVGPAHIIGGPRLGATIDAEPDGQESSTRTGDGRDEDGVKFPQLLVPGSNATILVTASAPAVLDYFFDFDRSGILGDNPNEVFQAAVIAGENSLVVPVPPAHTTGNFTARFRLSTAGNLSPYGLAFDGEVEDYQVRTIITQVATTFQNFDGVTTPTLPGGWTSASVTVFGNPERHWTTVNTNSDTAPNHVFVPGAGYVSTNRLTSPTFTVNNTNQRIKFQHSYEHEYRWDGGVVEISINGGAFTDLVSAGGSFLSGGYASFLSTGATIGNRNAWSGSSSGYFETTIQLPSSSLNQNVALRWVEGTDVSFSEEGWRLDSIQTVRTSLALDFGDAPAPFPTANGSAGAAHAQETNLKLGANFDTEPNAAVSDDTNGTDDEDGVTFVGSVAQFATGSVTVVASGAGLLQGWIDFNDDGDWTDAGEQIFADQPVVSGPNNLTFPVGPGAVVTTNTYARFRVSSQSGLSFTGQAPDGEVEDYALAIVAPTTFVVTGATPTTTGVDLTFNRDIDISQLNLYDADNGLFGAADVVLSGAAVGNIRGSLVVDSGLRRIRFIATAGLLPPDNYTVTLRSAANGFRDIGTELLDGDANGAAGGNYVRTFVVDPPAVNAVTIGLPNFARGPQQSVHLPANVSTGIPLSFSNGAGITSANFELRYDPALLTLSSAAVAAGLPVGATVNLNTSTAGLAVVQFASPTPLPTGVTRFVDLQASVPSTAIYRNKHILDISNIVLNGGSIPGLDDDALHVAAYFGDASGSGTYGGSDGLRMSRLAVALDTGLPNYRLLDAKIIADINGNNDIAAADTFNVMQVVVAHDVAEIPPRPNGASPLLGGPDPLLSIPTTLAAAAGSAVVIPVNIDSIVDLTGDGLESADLVIYYDPTVLDVQSVALGSLLTEQADPWIISSRIDPHAGRVFVSVAALNPLEGTFAGELIQLHGAVRVDARAGSTAINLAAGSRDPGRSTGLNEGYLTLIPPPTDAANDAGVDGLLTVTAAPSAPQVTAVIVDNQLLITGTSGDDQIFVGLVNGNQVRVRSGRRLLGDFALPPGIAIHGLTGNDYIVVSPALRALIVTSEAAAAAENVIFASSHSRVIDAFALPAIQRPDSQSAHDLALLEYLANWPADETGAPPIFGRRRR